MSDIIPTILMLLFWIFIVSAIGRFFKKIFGSGQQNNQTKTTTQQNKTPQTFQDIFRELKKQVEETQKKQNIPPYAKQEKYPDLKTIQDEAKKQQDYLKRKAEIKKQGPIGQKKYEHQEMVPESEKQSTREYQKVVAEERKREHDAEQRRLEKKIFAPPEEEVYEPYQVDLRNAIIGSIILERKF